MKQRAESNKQNKKTSFLEVRSDFSATGIVSNGMLSIIVVMFVYLASEQSDNEDPSHSELAIPEYRRESKLPSIHYGTPKTRAEIQLPVQTPAGPVPKKKSVTQIDPDKIELTADNVIVDVEQGAFHPGGGTLTFSLNSATCGDESWIVFPPEQEDPERHTLIELAKERLKAAIKSKRDLQIQAQQRQADGPLELRYYGERTHAG